MFLFYLLITYLIPGLYVYLRINYLLIPKGKKWLFTLVWIFLLAAFPLTEIFLHEEPARFFIPLLKLGYYTMPYMLYLFLLVLLFDIFLLLDLAFRWLPAGFFKSPVFRKYGSMSGIFLPSLVVLFGIYNFSHIRTSEYSIELPAGSSNIQTLEVVFVSDFHISDLTSISFVERFFEKMKRINPDIILFGGDMLEGDREDLRTRRIEALFRQLEARYGIYGVFGNHEHHREQKSHWFYERAGIELLQDTILLIDSSFYLAGRKDSRSRERQPVKDLTETIRENYPVLLLDHRPTDLVAASESRVDLQLSGHTHHGQLFPFHFITRHLYELSWGHKQINGTHFFVSSGIQLWGPPVRTIGKSEIMVIHLSFK